MTFKIHSPSRSISKTESKRGHFLILWKIREILTSGSIYMQHSNGKQCQNHLIYALVRKSDILPCFQHLIYVRCKKSPSGSIQKQNIIPFSGLNKQVKYILFVIIKTYFTSESTEKRSNWEHLAGARWRSILPLSIYIINTLNIFLWYLWMFIL